MSIQLGDPEIAPSSGKIRTGGRLTGWRIPIAFALGCGLVGFIVASIIPHSYKVDTTLYFPSESGGDSASGLISKFVGAAGAAGATGGGEASADLGSVSLLGGMFQQPEVASGSGTAIAVLDSTRCKEAVADDLNLRQVWRMKKRSDVLNRLQSEVTYGVDKNNLLAIEVVDTDPHLALQIARSYLDNLQQISATMSTSYSHRNRVFIDDELKAERATLDSEVARLVALQKREGLKSMSSDATDKIGTAYMDLQERKTEAQIELRAADSEIGYVVRTADLTVKNSANLPQDIPVAQNTRDQLRNLEARFAYDKATLGPDNPVYNQDKLQLATVRKAMSDEVEREAMALKEGISPEVATLYATRASLQAESEGLEDAGKQMDTLMQSLPSSQAEYLKMQGNIKITTATVGMLAEEEEKARIAEERDNPSYMVMDSPELPDEPFKPRKLFVTCACVAAGFLIGCAWLLAESMRRSAGSGEALPERD